MVILVSFPYTVKKHRNPVTIWYNVLYVNEVKFVHSIVQMFCKFVCFFFVCLFIKLLKDVFEFPTLIAGLVHLLVLLILLPYILKLYYFVYTD